MPAKHVKFCFTTLYFWVSAKVRELGGGIKYAFEVNSWKQQSQFLPLMLLICIRPKRDPTIYKLEFFSFLWKLITFPYRRTAHISRLSEITVNWSTQDVILTLTRRPVVLVLRIASGVDRKLCYLTCSNMNHQAANLTLLLTNSRECRIIIPDPVP